MFPTDVRAFFHGISAAAGKLGAILAASVFSQARAAGGVAAGWGGMGRPRRASPAAGVTGRWALGGVPRRATPALRARHLPAG